MGGQGEGKSGDDEDTANGSGTWGGVLCSVTSESCRLPRLFPWIINRHLLWALLCTRLGHR